MNSPQILRIQSFEMKKYIFILLLLSALSSCDNTTKIEGGTFYNINVLPHPKQVDVTQKAVILSEASQLYATNAKLYPLLEILKSDIRNLTGIGLETTTKKNRKADIIFDLDTSMASEEYRIDIDDTVRVSGGSYAALAMAKSTLLQLIVKETDKLMFPLTNIRDFPNAAYRGLMIDLARQWHSTATIKKLIDLAAFYKINYVQLHFTDYQSYTLPCRKYPKLSTPDRHYSIEELKDLETYSQARGVTIIPEVDVPGHSSPFVEAYPEIFAIEDTASNP